MKLFGRSLNTPRKKELDKYSRAWIHSLSDEDLEIEREIVRKAYCSSGVQINSVINLETLLDWFDDEMRHRRYGDEETEGFPVHREHGWYLSNDD